MRQLTKVARDLWSTRGRVAFMVLALAAGLTSMGAVLSMRSVLQREMNRDYLASKPASVTFDVGERGLPNALLDRLRDRPEVSWAEPRATREGRWRRPGNADWGRAMIFVIEDFNDQRLVGCVRSSQQKLAAILRRCRRSSAAGTAGFDRRSWST